MAKLAKDIAAGAVLIASATAVAIGYLVFASRLQDPSARLIDRVRDAPVDLTLIALLVTVIVVIATKAISGAGWMALTYQFGDSHHRFLVPSIAFLMALLVAQTRVESGVHSVLEVT